MKLQKICRFTKPELDYFRENCNFTDEELEYFNLKAKDESICKIADVMNISEAKVSKLARRVKDKIIKIL